MRMRAPKRPDKFPVPPPIPTLTKPTEEEFAKLNSTEGFTIKWEIIEKLFADYQKQYAKDKELTEKMTKGYGRIDNKNFCGFCRKVVNDPVQCI